MQAKRPIYRLNRWGIRMKEVKILLYRNLLEFKNKYLSYILLWFLLPMIFHLLLTSPLSNILIDTIPVEPIEGVAEIKYISYESWSLTGLWICCSCLFAFLYSFLKLRNLLVEQNQLQKYLKTPISNGQFLFSLLVSSVFVGIIQLFVSIFITLNLDIEGVVISGSFQLLLIFCNIFFLILFFSILGLLFGFYVKDNLTSGLVIFMIFIFISFSLGTVLPIPLEDPNQFFTFIKKLPIYEIVLNTHRLITGSLINVPTLLLNTIINALLFSITVVLSYKKFRK